MEWRPFLVWFFNLLTILYYHRFSVRSMCLYNLNREIHALIYKIILFEKIHGIYQCHDHVNFSLAPFFVTIGAAVRIVCAPGILKVDLEKSVRCILKLPLEYFLF